jgi:periplasmic divalent cation tolerance protein
MNFCLAYITTANKKEAFKIGEVLVKEKLAACINIISPIGSIYRWKGKIEKAREAFLIVKTKKSLAGKIIKKVKLMHSYECPEIIFSPIVGGSKDYLEWVKESTK